MRLVYSRRALADLQRIATYYAANVSPRVAQSIERRLVTVLNVFAACLKLLRAFHNVLRYGWPPSFATDSGFSIECAATQSISCTSGIRRDGLW